MKKLTPDALSQQETCSEAFGKRGAGTEKEFTLAREAMVNGLIKE